MAAPSAMGRHAIILPEKRVTAFRNLIAGGVLALFAGLGPAGAAALETGGQATMSEVIDGDTLVLENGATVRLVGIQAPKLPLGRKGFEAQPLAEEARVLLENLTRGRTLTLSFGGARRDRHGRLLAHLHDETGTWIQGEILRRGYGRVYTFGDNRALAHEMAALEEAARAAGLGIWAVPFYRVRQVEETPRHIDSFQIIEGRVRDAAIVRGRAYLNFGDDWRTDFTVSISSKDRRTFEAAGIDILAYRGRRVRVRGWLESYNGPMIEATHPEQIEVLDE